MAAETPAEADRGDGVLTRGMGVFFGLGSLCFVIGPLNAYVSAVGGRADALTFFIGSILFTLGGAAQCLLAAPERLSRPAGLAGWRTAWIQSVGTLLFNVMTFLAISVAATSPRYDTVVWGPNAAGSVCFLASGTIFYLSCPRRGLLPLRDHKGWWEASVNMLGCILFAVSAVTGYATGHDGSLVSTPVSDWTTTLGAACFLAVALTACGLGVTLKAPRLRRLREAARDAVIAVEHEAQAVAMAVERGAREVREVVTAAEHQVREAIDVTGPETQETR